MPNGVVNGTIHFLGQDNQNEVQHHFYGHLMPLMLTSALHDADNIFNHTIALYRSIQSN